MIYHPTIPRHKNSHKPIIMVFNSLNIHKICKNHFKIKLFFFLLGKNIKQLNFQNF